MTDKALVSVIAKVIDQHQHDWFTSRELAKAIIDAVEPLIRADERALSGTAWRLDREIARSDYRADLRAKVEALPHTNKCDTQDPVYAGRGKTMRCTCWQAEVLALLDGGSDE